MTDQLHLRRKWTLRAHGRRMVFVKRPREHVHHVLMKAFLWALYLPRYPDLAVEVSIGSRYKPDLVALDEEGRPLFWGEAGHVGARKMDTLLTRYRGTHFALAKWSTPLAPFTALARKSLDRSSRSAPLDLLRFPADSAERFISSGGEIEITHEMLEWKRLG